MVVFRLDANRRIGSGHAMRCRAIAAELSGMGEGSLFAVSDGESEAFAASLGLGVRVVGGDCMSLGAPDGESLGELCREVGASAVLVDTYAIEDGFFPALSGCLPSGVIVAHVDDCYTYSEGRMGSPRDRGVGLVVNYGFAFSEGDYRSALARGATVLAGPRYSPVRPGFRGGFEVRDRVGRVMVTSGSTNPDRALERMVEGVRSSGVGRVLTVVVGRQAAFDETCLAGCEHEVLHDVSDMAGLMRASDVVVSAAGTTLYELACVGVPTVALPIVENQLPNAEGFGRLGLGPSLTRLGWDAADVGACLESLASQEARSIVSGRLADEVDGAGARRIARALCV